MNKLKLLLYGDYFERPTGFAREFRDLIPELQKLGYDIRQVGLDYNGFPEDKNIKVYPANFHKSQGYWGREMLEFAMSEFDPDIVLSLHDYYALPKIAFAMAYPMKAKWIHWGVCLTGETEIILADGKIETIKNIVEKKKKVSVLSYDEKNKKFVEKKVIDWYKNKSSIKDWVRITIRNGIYKGSINATFEHPFMTQRGWIKTNNLILGDKVVREVNGITKEGIQAILGMYIGDGWKQNNGESFFWGHTIKQKKYMEDTCKKLETKISRKITKSGYGKNIENLKSGISFKTICPEIIKFLNKKQKVSKELLNNLGDIGLAYWYMDDGTLKKDKRYPNYFRADFCTQGFSKKEIKIIEKYFYSIGINTKIYRTDRKQIGNEKTAYLSVTIDRENNDLFFSKIAPFTHKSMNYKLPPKYQSISKINKIFRKKKILEFDFIKRKLSSYTTGENNRKGIDVNFRYDIKVENTHNFIANGYLVHNCDGDLLGFGNKEALKWVDYNLYHSNAAKKEIERVLPSIKGEKFVPAVNPKNFFELNKQQLRKDFACENNFVITTLARNQTRKNLPALIAAMPEIKKQIPEALLLLGVTHDTLTPGGKKEGHEIEYLIDYYKVEDCVVLPREKKGDGSLTNKTIREIYNLGDIFCLPSMGEGYGMIFHESLACGVPVIGTNCSAVPETIQGFGWLLEPSVKMHAYDGTTQAVVSPEEITRLIWKANKSKEERKEKSRLGKKFVATLTPKIQAQKLDAIMKKVIQNDYKSLIRKQKNG